jgi:hypothetical protein
MNLVRTCPACPLEVCVRILLHGTGHHWVTARLSTVQYGTVQYLWAKPGLRLEMPLKWRDAFILSKVIVGISWRRALVHASLHVQYSSLTPVNHT